MNIVNVGYDSANYYVLADTSPRLLIDVGWPGTLPQLRHECKRMGIHLPEVKHFLATHYHPDHAGLAQELKNAGCTLIVVETQTAAVPLLKAVMKPQNHYLDIDLADAVRLPLAGSRAFLARLGVRGEIVSTPGHSDDSITLILDEGAAFSGDLPHPLMVEADPANPAYRSWEKLRALGVKIVYPGHGPAWPLAQR